MTPEDLKRYRLSLGLTQRELAVALCVSVRSVVAWETGTRNMPPSCQKLFCILYGLPFVSSRADYDDQTPDLFDWG